jgi:hypothetical protein
MIVRDAGGGAYQIAEVRAALGDREAAIQWLDRAARQNDAGLFFMRVDPLFPDFAGDPRITALLKKVAAA